MAESKNRIVVTGGSGFIGTNLVEHLRVKGHDVLSIDNSAPRNIAHIPHWRKVDFLDKALLTKVLSDFDPTTVFHLGARTDLNGGEIAAYRANVGGVENMVQALKTLRNLERVVFASSMLVCRLGYLPKNDDDYCPNTVYGASKVEGEQIVRREQDLPWIIVRPTSLWGPWFDVPYRSFFDAIKGGWYLHPRGLKVYRSYGFVLNSVFQLEELISAPSIDVNHKIFYLADDQPIELGHWANLIQHTFGCRRVRQVPLGLLKLAARTGDLLKLLGWPNPPLTSFRLNNLTTDAVFDTACLPPIKEQLPYKIEEATRLTVDWMLEGENQFSEHANSETIH